MFGRLFGNYLVKNQIIDQETLELVLEEQSKIRAKLGVIAVANKLMTVEQAEEVNKLQAERDLRFGDIAVEKGYLSASQVEDLLEQQGNPYMQFLQVFVEKCKVKVSKIDGYIEEFQKEIGLNDEEMEALKRNDFEALLPVYAFASKPYVTDIVGLVLRNINRFVTSDFYFDRIRSVDSFDYKTMTVQKSTGDANVYIGFASTDSLEGLSMIASGYSGVDCSGRNLETIDGVGEFANCISGLLSTNLSKNDVHLEIQPQISYENQSAKGNAYVFTIYIKGKSIHLYIAVDTENIIGTMPLIRKIRAKEEFVDASDSKGTILIVDDSGMSRMMLRKLLEEAGYTVIAEASDGLEGVMAYKQFNPELVTLDITMPNMDGIEALRQIMDYDEEARAIMITAAGQQNKIIEALKLGADKFITKPYDKAEVLKAVDEIFM